VARYKNFFYRVCNYSPGGNMALEQESRANAKLTFQNPPAVTAEAIIDIVNSIGKVKTVHRESGVIDGKITRGVAFGTSPRLKIQVRGSGEGTEIDIDLRCTESALVNYHRAEKALRILTEQIASHPTLRLASNTGW